MKYLKYIFIIIFCVGSLVLPAQKTYVWNSVSIGGAITAYPSPSSYEMWDFDIHTGSRTLLFTLDSTRFIHPNMVGNTFLINSFAFSSDKTDIYFLEKEGDLYSYNISGDVVTYVKDLTPENTNFFFHQHTFTTQIDQLNDSLYYISGYTYGYLNINDYSFDLIRQCPDFSSAGSDYELDIASVKTTKFKDDYIYLSGWRNFAKSDIDNPENNSLIWDIEHIILYYGLYTNPFSYQYNCDSTILYTMYDRYDGQWARDSIYIDKIDLDNQVISRHATYPGLTSSNYSGNTIIEVNHYNDIEWEDCQRYIDLDMDDSTAPDSDFSLDSLCGFEGIALSDIDIEIRNEYPIDSIVIEVLTLSAMVNMFINAGNYTYNNNTNKLVIYNNGTSINQEFEEAIRNGYLDNPSQDMELMLSFTVWYNGIGGNPAIAHLYFGSTPNAGEDILLEFCEEDQNLQLTNLTSAGADTGGVFYNDNYIEITEFPDYIAKDTILVYYKVSNDFCFDTSEITVITNPIPTIMEEKDYTLCDGETIDINFNIGTHSILWNDEDTNSVKTISTSGEYIYTITNIYGCSSSDTFLVNILPPAQMQPIEAKVCEGEQFLFNGKYYNEIGIYQDTLVSAHGCDSIYYNIDFNYFDNEPIIIEGELGICDELTTTLWIVSEHNDLLLNNMSIDESIEISKIGSYTLSGYDINGCYEELDFEIVNYPSPEVVTEDLIDTTFHIGIGLPVFYQGQVDFYQWSPSINLDCDDCPYPQLQESMDGIYHIEVENEYGCIDDSDITVRFNTSNIYLPTIISLGADDPQNRSLYLQGNINGVYEMNIFDRWGGLLYNKKDLAINDPSQGWHPGDEIKPGVYVYLISYVENGKLKKIVNDITVVK